MSLAVAPKKDARVLLHAFFYGSLLVLLVCLCATAFIFSATYLKKERARAEISLDQLSHSFDFQYRSVTEEMWTQNYEAINLRIGAIARQLGHAPYNLVLTDVKGTCVYAASQGGTPIRCEVPTALSEQIPAYRPGPPQPTLRFDEASNQYIYMVPLYVGAVLRGYMYAAISDPYEFYRGNSVVLALKIFIVPIACALIAWFFWLLASKRFILRPYLSSLVEMEKKQALGDLAAQVAHDVRSPAETIKSVARNTRGLEEKERKLLTAASSRIENIANDLIAQYTNAIRPESESFTFLAAAVDSIVAEKTAMLGEAASLEIRADLARELCLVGVPISATELSRVLSNIFNNSIDALRGVLAGSIAVTARMNGNTVCLSVADNGPGIDPSILHKLRTVGGTYGKTGGAGIGLLHAKSALAKIGGNLTIDSTLGKGTNVTLEMPVAAMPAWCARSLEVLDGETVVVLDDDQGIHLMWKERLGEIGVVYLTDPEQFDLGLYPPSKSRYIFDYDISGSPVTGLDLIVSHKLGSKAVLVTSYFNEPKIQRAVELAGASMLPKFMISKVRISRPAGSESTPADAPVQSKYDLVLIDDDSLVHDLWKFEAESARKRILTLHSPEEFPHGEIHPRTPLYIDKNLARGVSGLTVAGDFHANGFERIFITTGEKLSPDQAPPYIRGIIDKGFPEVAG